MKNNNTTLIIFLLVILFVAGGLYLWATPNEESAPEAENGTSETSTPPTDETNNEWITATSSEGVTFEYPEKLSTTYIHTVDWPPRVQVTQDPYSCTEAGEETARAGRTEPRSIDDREYCVTKVVEGAAGSIYTQYAYAFEEEDSVIILTFSLRAPQCGNYDEPERSECEDEQETFDTDELISRIVETIKL